MARHAVDAVLHLLDVDRRTNQGRDRLSVERPVHMSIPLTPMEYDALRFLASLYPANPGEILRASVIRCLDRDASIPVGHLDGMEMERTARVDLGLEEDEAGRLREIAGEEGVSPEEIVDMPNGRL